MSEIDLAYVEHLEDELANVRHLYDALMPTTETPQFPGTYWFRAGSDHRWAAVEVFMDEADHEWSVRTGPFTDQVDYIKNWHGEWAGPWPEPFPSEQ